MLEFHSREWNFPNPRKGRDLRCRSPSISGWLTDSGSDLIPRESDGRGRSSGRQQPPGQPLFLEPGPVQARFRKEPGRSRLKWNSIGAASVVMQDY